MTRALVLPSAPVVAMARGVAVLLALAAVAVLVRAHSAALVLAGIAGLVGFVWLLLRPQLATLAVVFLIYINAPAVAVLHGLPRAAAGGVLLLLVIPLLDRLLVRRERAHADVVLGIMVGFLCVMVLASLGARGKDVAIDRLVTYLTEGVLLYWLVTNVVTTRTALRQVTWALLAAGAFLGSLSVYQAVTRSYQQQFGGFAARQLEWEYKRELDLAAGISEPRLYRADRAEGPQVGNNRYAQIMLVLLPVALLRLRHGRGRLRRTQALAAGVLILVGGVALTYSRGALLGLVVLAPTAVLVGWLRARHVMILGIAVLLLLPVAAPTVLQRITSLGGVTALRDPGADGSLRGRATEMLAALHVFADHPIIGVGPGQYAPFYSADYHQLPGIKFRDIQTSRRAHSLYLEMAAETGIVGLLTFLAIPALLLRSLWRAHRRLVLRDRELADTAAAFWLAMIGFLFAALFLSHAFERYYWLLVALAGAALHVIARHEVGGTRTGGPPVARPEAIGAVQSW